MRSPSCCFGSLNGLLMFEIGVEVGPELPSGAELFAFEVCPPTSSEKWTLLGAAEVESGDVALNGRLEFVDSGVSPPGVEPVLCEVALRGSSPDVSTRHLGRIVDTSPDDVAPPGVEPVFAGRMLLIRINWTNKCGV